jgi:hypothetical protein
LLALAAVGCASTPPPKSETPGSVAGQAAAPAAGQALAKPPAVAGVPVGPPIVILPAAATRSMLLVSISVSSIDKLLASGAELVGRAVPLPVDPAGVRDLMLQQAGLSPEVSANLDLGSPSGAALVALGAGAGAGGAGAGGAGAAARTGLVMAVAARGTAEAERVIAGLGKVIMKRGEVVLVDNGSGGRGWILRAGSVIVLSDDADALARGATLALEARLSGSRKGEDATAVIYPDAIARAHGTDVKTALTRLGSELRAQRAADAVRAGGGAGGASPGPSAAEDQTYESMLELLSLAADTETGEIGLSVDSRRGLGLQARLRPRAASALQAMARDARSFTFEPAVLGGAAPALVAAGSYGPFIRAMMARQRARLAAAKEKGAETALAFYDATLDAMAGQVSLGARVLSESHNVTARIVYPLKDAAAAAKLAAAMARVDKSAAGALWAAQAGSGAGSFDFTVKKETVGKLKALHYVLTVRADAPAADAIKKIFGSKLDSYVAVSGTRLLGTFGKSARAELTALAAAKPAAADAAGAAAAPAGPLADALVAARGRDGFLFFDVGSFLALMTAVMPGDARADLFAHSAPAIPLYATAGGDGAGRVWTADLTLPPQAFVGAGVVLGKMMGSGVLRAP